MILYDRGTVYISIPRELFSKIQYSLKRVTVTGRISKLVLSSFKEQAKTLSLNFHKKETKIVKLKTISGCAESRYGTFLLL